MGPDGNIWYTANFSQIGRIDPAGNVQLFGSTNPRARIRGPERIVAGPDGTLWFTNPEDATIGRITTAGAVTTFGDRTLGPRSIATGPDGDLWFTNDKSETVRASRRPAR